MPLSNRSDAVRLMPAASGLRDELRSGTRQVHAALDARIMALGLADETGYRRFLVANLLAWSALQAPWRRFLARTGAPAGVPDYPAMLRADLAECGGGAAPTLPALAVPAAALRGASGTAYVLAGSRIGMAAVRRMPIWESTDGAARRFVDDDSGAALFRGVTDRLDRIAHGSAERAAALPAALAAFAVFGAALDSAVAAPV